jgi:hypothetical protein
MLAKLFVEKELAFRHFSAGWRYGQSITRLLRWLLKTIQDYENPAKNRFAGP